jgi:phage terminase large subunit-like protein
MKSPLREESSSASAWLDELTPEEFEEFERRHGWVAHQARPEQLTPEGNWKTWLLLAGRGFGKTRTAAEDFAAFGLDHPKSILAVVAETFADGRDICVEGESGLLSCLPRSAVRHWNRSIGELFLANGTKYRLFSGDKPDNMRGYQHHRMWWDELAKFMYPEEAWTQGQLGLRLGDDPQNVVTTTPRPIPLIQELVERDNVVITSGSTFDNEENLAESFIEEVRLRYEGTKLGAQELYGQIVYLDDESAFKREWFKNNRYSRDEARAFWNRCVGRYIALDTANTTKETSAYSAFVVGDVQPEYTMPIRHVERERLEFPELVEWTIEKLHPFAHDHKLKAVFIENAASGTQLIQTLRKSGPKWLAPKVIGIQPNRGPNGKEQGWKAASVWAKRGMIFLPDPTNDVDWLHDFEAEVFMAPNSRFLDQTDALAMLINSVEKYQHIFSTRWHALDRRASVA